MTSVTTFRKYGQQRNYRWEEAMGETTPGVNLFRYHTAERIHRGRRMREGSTLPGGGRNTFARAREAMGGSPASRPA